MMYPLVNVYILPWKITMLLMGKSTISMAIFNCFLYVHQRVSQYPLVYHHVVHEKTGHLGTWSDPSNQVEQQLKWLQKGHRISVVWYGLPDVSWFKLQQFRVSPAFASSSIRCFCVATIYKKYSKSSHPIEHLSEWQQKRLGYKVSLIA